MRQKTLLFLLALLTPFGVFVRFEFMLVGCVLCFLLFLASFIGGNFIQNYNLFIKNRFNFVLFTVLLLVLISYLNPHAKLVKADGYYYLSAIKHIEWLPSTILGTNDRGSLCFVVLWLSVFYFFNATLINIDSRKNALFLAKSFVFIGVCSSLYIVFSTLANTRSNITDFDKHLFGIIEGVGMSVTGSFFSRNAASQYTILTLFVAIGFALDSFKQTLIEQRSIFAFIAYSLVCLIDVAALCCCVQSQSLVGGALGIVVYVFGCFYISVKYGHNPAMLVFKGVVFAAVLIGFVYVSIFIASPTIVDKLKSETKAKIEKRIHPEENENLISDRILIWNRGIETFLKNKMWGVGANNFVYYSYDIYWSKQKSYNVDISYSTHSDFIQLLTEFGLFGGIYVFLASIIGLGFVLKKSVDSTMKSVSLMGVFLVLLISFFDCTFQLTNVVLVIFGIIAVIVSPAFKTNLPQGY